MKKMIVLVNFFLIIVLSSQLSFSYTITDPVGDRIGGRPFEIYGIDVLRISTNLTVGLYTNYPQGGYTVGLWKTFAGDLAIDADNDGAFEYGVALTNHDGFSAGSLYNVASWYTSNHYAPSSGYIYNQGEIVTIQSGTLAGVASLSWVGLTVGPDYRIDVNLDPNLLQGLGEHIGLHWSSATCANDYVAGATSVAEPATMILLGSGLFGLAGFVRRKLRK